MTELTVFLDSLRQELALRFRVPPTNDGVERIVREARLHLEESTAELVASGLQEDAAAARALSRFGTAAEVARSYPKTPDFVEHRISSRRWFAALFERRSTMGSLLSELRLAVRGLMRSPAYALAFVLTLGLGIGANTAIFSVVNGVWLRPLPYRDGDNIVYLRHGARLANIDNALFSVPEIEDYRVQVPAFDGVAEFSALTFTMLGLDEPRRVRAGIVTGNYFEVMGLGARLGRLISETDDPETASPVAVLTHEFWNRVFGADPEILGQIVTMNGRAVEIVGVAEPAPPYPERTDLYVNMVVSPHHMSASMNHDRVHRMTEVFAHLSPEATLQTARVQLDEVTARLHDDYPGAYDPTHGYEVRATLLRNQLAEQARPTMLMLLGVAAFVLVIACANVANLTLTRVVQRHDEWSLRISLGAKPSTLRRQLLLENLVPSLGGAFLGLLVAYAGVGLLVSYVSQYSVRASEITVDGTVLVVALTVALAAACLFALIPRLPGTGPRSVVSPGSTRATASVSGRRTQKFLVVSQMSVCFVLLAGAALLLQTLLNLQGDDGGLELDEVLAMNVPLMAHKRTDAEQKTYYQTIVERVSQLPGVRGTALGSRIPLQGVPSGLTAFIANLEFEIESQPTEPGAPPPRADFRSVSNDYFRTLGMSLAEGRLFQATDEGESLPVVVVNEAFARHYFADRNPVGQRIGWRGDILQYIGVNADYRTIVGVVSNAKDYGVAHDVPHVVFHPYAQVPAADSLFIRTSQPDAVRLSAVQRIRELDPDQPIEDVATLAEVREQAISSQRLNATLVGLFALVALTVAAVGVGGVLAFGVSQRTNEFGVRAAMGADGTRLMRVVLVEGAMLAAAGLAIGLVASILLSELIAGLLYQVAPTDTKTFVLVAALLVIVALAASAFPAWRASRIDPVEALRAE